MNKSVLHADTGHTNNAKAFHCHRTCITRGINVSLEDNELTIDFHVIVSYGVSILAVYNNLTDSVKYHVEEFTGIRVKKINMYVEGVRVID